jgi:hypothetical protein
MVVEVVVVGLLDGGGGGGWWWWWWREGGARERYVFARVLMVTATLSVWPPTPIQGLKTAYNANA